MAHCIYCGRTSALMREDAPNEHDDDAWATESGSHAPKCEWILTRAHRIDPRSATMPTLNARGECLVRTDRQPHCGS